MDTRSYQDTINFATEHAPSLEKPAVFIKWAEPICECIAYVYTKDYDEVTEDLFESVKDYQSYEDEYDE